MNAPPHHVRKTPSPKQNQNQSSRLRTPRGSPGTAGRGERSSFSCCHYCYYYCYQRLAVGLYRRTTFFLLFPGILLLMQWTIRSAENASPRTHSPLSLTTVLEEQRTRSNRHRHATDKTLLRAAAAAGTSDPTLLLQKEQRRKQLQEFDPAAHPVVSSSMYQPRLAHPLRVVFLGTAAAVSEILDGLERSEYARVVQTALYDPVRRSIQASQWHSGGHNNNKPVVYVVDWEGLVRDCHVLERMLAQIISTAHSNRTSSTGGTGTAVSVGGGPDDEPLRYLLHVDLGASARVVSCPRLTSYFHLTRTRQAKRSIVQDRYWNHSGDWVQAGKLLDRGAESRGAILHAPLFVTESFVEELQMQNGTHSLNDASFADQQLPTRQRDQDVAHFWKDGDNSHYSFLRQRVASSVAALNGTSVHGRPVQWLGKVVYRQGTLVPGESNPMREEYIRNLLSTKIVVVAQNDEWEDQPILMEALASGAMVMTDAMLAPPWGLKNRSNVVIYDGPSSLEKLMRYYLHPQNERRRLSIAQKGWELVMSEHRSWTRMEALLFGKSYTRAKQGTPSKKHKV